MCWVSVSTKLQNTILFLWTWGQRGLVAAAVLYLYITTRKMESVQIWEWPRDEETEEYMRRHWAGFFFYLLAKRNKRSWVSETESDNKVLLSILTALLLHLGHLLLSCHLPCQWQMTQHQSWGSRRRSPGTHPPQAKLAQDPIHLPHTSPPPPSSLLCF